MSVDWDEEASASGQTSDEMLFGGGGAILATAEQVWAEMLFAGGGMVMNFHVPFEEIWFGLDETLFLGEEDMFFGWDDMFFLCEEMF